MPFFPFDKTQQKHQQHKQHKTFCQKKFELEKKIQLNKQREKTAAINVYFLLYEIDIPYNNNVFY